MQYTKQEYLNYLDKKSPNSPIWKDTILSFLFGGAICTVGQGFLNLYQNILHLESEQARTAVSITMIFLGALLTGLDIYCKIAKYAGAGTLVPITGFANSIVAPAIEFKAEGFILGVAAKMFVIAGPVLVYGITTSCAVGLIAFIMQWIGG